MNDDLADVPQSVHEFIQKEFTPHQIRWREQHRPDDEAWKAAGAVRLTVSRRSEEYGGGAASFIHEAVVVEELAHAGVAIWLLYSRHVAAITLVAYGTEDQKRKLAPSNGSRRNW